MDFKIKLDGFGINKTVKLTDSIKNTRKVFTYQKDLEELYDIDVNDPVAYTEAQQKSVDHILAFLEDMLDLSEAQLAKLEDQSFLEVSKVAGVICNEVLRRDPVEEDADEEGLQEDTKE